MNDDLYLSDDRYLAALRRQRDRINTGEPFEAYDCEEIGAKETHASWGLCSSDAAAWPDADDHMRPDQFTEHGRVVPKYRRRHQTCPMQTKGEAWGCFYNCRIFKSQLGRKSRDKAVQLYDERIAAVEAREIAVGGSHGR